MHVPKTAGTSTRVMLETELSDKKIFPNQKFIEEYGGYPEIIKLKEYKEVISSAHLVMGHYPLSWALNHIPQFSYITFIRNPVDRVISHLKHLRKYDDKCTNLSLDEIYALPFFRKQFDNLQVRYFLDYDQKKQVGGKDLERAFENAKKFAFIGTSENFQKDIKLLFDFLQLNSDKMVKINVSNDFLKPNLKPNSALVDLIKEQHTYDQSFYDQVSHELKK